MDQRFEMVDKRRQLGKLTGANMTPHEKAEMKRGGAYVPKLALDGSGKNRTGSSD